jgi:hypothetical protein
VKYDNLLKTIFYDAMPALIRLLGVAPVAEYLTVEFPERPKLVADVVARLTDGSILHLEFQLTNDPRMHWRCYHYYGTIQEMWEESEMIQVVIFVGNDAMRMKTGVDRTKCKYWYDVLDMNDVPASTFLESTNDAERVMALLCDSADPRETVKQVLASWKGQPEKQLWENIERLRVLSQLRGFEIIAIEEIERMPFDLIDETDSIWYKRGEARGEARGETAGMAKIVLRLLDHRFGPLSDSVRERLTTASKEQLEQWADRVPDARQLSDVFGS